MLKSYYLSTVLFLLDLVDINNISFITMPKQIQKNKTPQYQTTWILIL